MNCVCLIPCTHSEIKYKKTFPYAESYGIVSFKDLNSDDNSNQSTNNTNSNVLKKFTGYISMIDLLIQNIQLIILCP
mgnify:CR=1 FL=1